MKIIYKKKHFNIAFSSFIICLFFVQYGQAQNNVGIGTTSPRPQAVLDISASDKGLLFPRLTTIQRSSLGTTLTAASNPLDKGMTVYDTNEDSFYFWNGTAWEKFSPPSVTQVNTGSGLTGGPITTSGTISLIDGTAVGQVLKWNGTSWVLSPDANNTYTGGTGISISVGNIISVSNAGIGTLQIADGAITNTKIADGVVDNAKISDVAWSKITGAPASFPPSGAAGGDLTGTYPNPTVNNLAITDAKIASVAPSKLLQAGAATGNVLSWNGTQWTPTNGSGNFIQNQNALDQTADFRINGIGKMNGGVLVGAATTVNNLVNIAKTTAPGTNKDQGVFMDIHNTNGVSESASGIRFKVNSLTSNERWNAAVFHRLNNFVLGEFNIAIKPNSVANISQNDIKLSIYETGETVIGKNQYMDFFNGQADTLGLLQVIPDINSTLDSAFVFKRNGRMAIGATAPHSKFLVRDVNATTNGSAGAFIDIQNNLNTSGVAAGLRFKNRADNGNAFYKAGVAFKSNSSFGRGDLVFYNNDAADNTNFTDSDIRMTVKNYGTVGIGTTTPLSDAVLQVAADKNTVSDSSFLVYRDGSIAAISPDVGTSIVPISGGGARMMWHAGRSALRAGRVTGAQWNQDSIGVQSVAFGLNTLALGAQSFAVGNATRATGSYSFSSGLNNLASGNGAAAIGQSNTASGLTSFAAGFSNNVSGTDAIVLGTSNTVSSTSAFAAGTSNNVSGTAGSFALGSANIVSGNATSFALGSSNNATGNTSAAIGNNLNTPSAFEVAVGRFNTNYTPNSTTGWNTNDRLFTIGNGTSNAIRNDALVVRKSGNVGIGVSAPTERLEVAGNATVSGEYRYAAVKTRQLVIPARAFQNNGSVAVTGDASGSRIGLVTAGSVFAPVNIPVGAVMTNIRWVIFDNSPIENNIGSLYRLQEGTGSPTLISQTTSVDNAAINNHSASISSTILSDYSYWVRWNPSGSTQNLYMCIITYTVTQAD